jgi:hypothetical protein
MSGFLHSIGLVQTYRLVLSLLYSEFLCLVSNVVFVCSHGLLTPLSRLRAPKRSPMNTPTSQNGFFEPLPSPSAEITAQFPPAPGGPRPLYLSQPFVKAALVKGSFKTIVAPPKYVDVNEWVAINCTCWELSFTLLLAVSMCTHDVLISAVTDSIRLLPQPESLLWCSDRVLYIRQLSDDVRRTNVSGFACPAISI